MIKVKYKHNTVFKLGVKNGRVKLTIPFLHKGSSLATLWEMVCYEIIGLMSISGYNQNWHTKVKALDLYNDENIMLYNIHNEVIFYYDIKTKCLIEN